MTLHPFASRFARAALVAAAALFVALLCAAAATPSGFGAGGTLDALWTPSDSLEAAVPVTFSFHREERGAGRISLKLGDPGENFVGNYLRLTGTRPLSSLRIIHTQWVDDDFEKLGVGPTGAASSRKLVTIEQFQQRYTGSVVATLVGEKGGAIRCVFALRHADDGLAGGASGRCQTSDGGSIDLVDPKRG